MLASHFAMKSGGPAVDGALSMLNQTPCLSENAVLEPANVKWKPGRRLFTPLKRGVVVNVSKSIPARACGGKFSSSNAEESAVSIVAAVVMTDV